MRKDVTHFVTNHGQTRQTDQRDEAQPHHGKASDREQEKFPLILLGDPDFIFGPNSQKNVFLFKDFLTLNNLHPNISLQVLHTLIHIIISFGTEEENWSNNQSFLGWRSFPLFS